MVFSCRIFFEVTLLKLTYCLQHFFEDKLESVNKILYNIDDICPVDYPDSDDIFDGIDNLVKRETDYLNKFCDLDDKFTTVEFSNLEKSIDDAIAYIRSIRENIPDMTMYNVGGIQELSEYRSCVDDMVASMLYHEENAGIIESVSEIYMDVHTIVAADNRAKKRMEKGKEWYRKNWDRCWRNNSSIKRSYRRNGSCSGNGSEWYYTYCVWNI